MLRVRWRVDLWTDHSIPRVRDPSSCTYLFISYAVVVLQYVAAGITSLALIRHYRLIARMLVMSHDSLTMIPRWLIAWLMVSQSFLLGFGFKWSTLLLPSSVSQWRTPHWDICRWTQLYARISCPYLRLVFAGKDLKVGSEVLFDYGDQFFQDA